MTLATYVPELTAPYQRLVQFRIYSRLNICNLVLFFKALVYNTIFQLVLCFSTALCFFRRIHGFYRCVNILFNSMVPVVFSLHQSRPSRPTLHLICDTNNSFSEQTPVLSSERVSREY